MSTVVQEVPRKEGLGERSNTGPSASLTITGSDVGKVLVRKIGDQTLYLVTKEDFKRIPVDEIEMWYKIKKGDVKSHG